MKCFPMAFRIWPEYAIKVLMTWLQLTSSVFLLHPWLPPFSLCPPCSREFCKLSVPTANVAHLRVFVRAVPSPWKHWSPRPSSKVPVILQDPAKCPSLWEVSPFQPQAEAVTLSFTLDCGQNRLRNAVLKHQNLLWEQTRSYFYRLADSRSSKGKVRRDFPSF